MSSASPASIRATAAVVTDKKDKSHALNGEFQLLRVFDDSGSEVPLPGEYVLRISTQDTDQEPRTNAQTGREVYVFRINIRIGNVLGGTVQVDLTAYEEPSRNKKQQEFPANVGPLFSTKMMVPPELDVVERALHKILPSTNSVGYDGDKITFHGSGGFISCVRKAF
ncbi:hypothetical protein ACA910_015815 [Epithemia clementina (nom. ined.)]